MPKRFTDTSIWDKEWFMSLSPKLKCLVRYLFDNCDQAGVWSPNWKLASLHIGEKVCAVDMQKIPGDQWEWFKGKVFLPDFIAFQNGTLSRNSPAHKPIFLLLEKYDLLDRVLSRVSNTLQVKVRERVIVKEEVTVKENAEEKKSENLLSGSTLEAAERNQFTHTGNRNTEFIKQQWEIFLLERHNDSSQKKRENNGRMGEYFLNWIRNKFPKQANGKKKIDFDKFREELKEHGHKKISEL